MLFRGGRREDRALVEGEGVEVAVVEAVGVMAGLGADMAGEWVAEEVIAKAEKREECK